MDGFKLTEEQQLVVVVLDEHFRTAPAEMADALQKFARVTAEQAPVIAMRTFLEGILMLGFTAAYVIEKREPDRERWLARAAEEYDRVHAMYLEARAIADAEEFAGAEPEGNA